MNPTEVYEFSLNWQGNFIPKPNLIELFNQKEWDYVEFKNISVKQEMFIDSISILLFAKEFEAI